jgi:hypothetical protein
MARDEPCPVSAVGTANGRMSRGSLRVHVELAAIFHYFFSRVVCTHLRIGPGESASITRSAMSAVSAEGKRSMEKASFWRSGERKGRSAQLVPS